MIATLTSMFDHMTGVVALPYDRRISIADFQNGKISNVSRPTGNIQWINIGHRNCPCDTCTTNATNPVNARS